MTLEKADRNANFILSKNWLTIWKQNKDGKRDRESDAIDSARHDVS